MSEPKLQLKIDLRSGKIDPELPAEDARDATTLAVMSQINAELPDIDRPTTALPLGEMPLLAAR